MYLRTNGARYRSLLIFATVKIETCYPAPHPVSVDGSASEYPFVLTWFMDGPPDSMEGPSEQMEDDDLKDDENITAFDTYMEDYY